MKKFLLLVLCLSGCGDGSGPPIQAGRSQVRKQTRFKVESYGWFEGGYGNHDREIFILTDEKTGKEYLTITGCGTTELWIETHTQGAGKTATTTTKTVEE